MELLWTRLENESGHDAAYRLLAQMIAPLPEIRKTDLGKPYFADSNLHFSVSHTKNHAFCAVSRRNIGIDAEETDRNIDLRLADKILSPTEKSRFDAAVDKRDALLRFWVLKEAFGKLAGKGWGNYLHETDFDPFDPRVQIIDGCYVATLTELGIRNCRV